MKQLIKKLSPGHYLYRGFHIDKVDNDKSWWEATDVDGSCFAQACSLRYVKAEIDDHYDRDKTLMEHCSRCKHYECVANAQMYCKLKCKGLTSKTENCNGFEYPVKRLTNYVDSEE